MLNHSYMSCHWISWRGDQWLPPQFPVSRLATGAFNYNIQISGKNIEQDGPWNWALTGHQSDVVSFGTTLWALPFRQYFTEHTMNLPIPQLDNLSRRMLWGIVSKALLKSRTISATFPWSTRLVALSQKDVKLNRIISWSHQPRQQPTITSPTSPPLSQIASWGGHLF